MEIEQFQAYDPNKPISINWDNKKMQLVGSSNLPWIEATSTGLKVNPMKLSQFLKYEKDNEGYNLFNYKVVQSSDKSDKFFIYFYRNGYYKRMASEEFKGMIRLYIPQLLRKKRDVDEIYADLISADKFIMESLFNADEDIINFQDGIYKVSTKELLPHSPKFLSTIQIPAKYKDIVESGDSAPVFDSYMDTLCNGNEEIKQILMRCIGLTISNVYGHRTKKVLFLVGKGDTGKSQLKKLVEALLGDENVSSIDLVDLSRSFGKSAIYGKRLIGCNDMSYQNINDMGIFKQTSGGDSINIEFKHGGFLNYTYKGFMWFNCNSLPPFSGDKGSWVYDRMLPVLCNNVIPPEKRDPKIFDKMYKEKNVIIKRSLKALDDLIADNFQIERTKEMDILLSEYEISNNTLLLFIKECCVKATDNVKTRRSTFNKCYDAWIKLYNNGKGKVGNETMKQILMDTYREGYKLSKGIYYMDKLAIMPEKMQELGIIEGGNDYV